MNTRKLINYWFYISLEKWIIIRVLRWCGNHVLYYFLFIDHKVSLKLKMLFLLIMRTLLNIVCNIILNVLHHMTTWCASYVGIKTMFSFFFHGT